MKSNINWTLKPYNFVLQLKQNFVIEWKKKYYSVRCKWLQIVINIYLYAETPFVYYVT